MDTNRSAPRKRSYRSDIAWRRNAMRGQLCRTRNLLKTMVNGANGYMTKAERLDIELCVHLLDSRILMMPKTVDAFLQQRGEDLCAHKG